MMVRIGAFIVVLHFLSISANANPRETRELQKLDAICGMMKNLLPTRGDNNTDEDSNAVVECSCGLDDNSSHGPTLEYQCTYDHQLSTSYQQLQHPPKLCFGTFCSTPHITGSINPIALKASAEYCFHDPIVQGIPLNKDLCLIVGGSDGAISTIGASGTTDINDLRGGLIDFCFVTLDGMPCNNCESCASGKGITFDCTNIDSNIIQSQCQIFQLLGTLQPRGNIGTNKNGENNNGKLQFFPVFDTI